MNIYIWCHPDTGQSAFEPFDGATWRGRYRAPAGSWLAPDRERGVLLHTHAGGSYTAAEIVLVIDGPLWAGIELIGHDNLSD